MIVIEAFQWIAENQSAFFSAFDRHLLLCFVSLTIALVIALPLGFKVAHSPAAAFAERGPENFFP